MLDFLCLGKYGVIEDDFLRLYEFLENEGYFFLPFCDFFFYGFPQRFANVCFDLLDEGYVVLIPEAPLVEFGEVFGKELPVDGVDQFLNFLSE